LGWTITLSLMAAALALYAFAGWRRAQPFNPNKVRMAPWLAIQALAAGSLFMLIVHAVNLAGWHTGAQQGLPN